MLDVFAVLRYQYWRELLQTLPDLGQDLFPYEGLDRFLGKVGRVDLYLEL